VSEKRAIISKVWYNQCKGNRSKEANNLRQEDGMFLYSNGQIRLRGFKQPTEVDLWIYEGEAAI